ncbi:MAG: PKD domain-containing protein, partial [Lentisphaerae bacterium]|nr:PKD domain-containing protein [Lentisphaerota bacterium]
MNIEFNNSRYVEKESNMSKKGAWSLLSRGWSRLIMATAALSLAGAVQAADIVSVHALQDGTYNVGDEIFIVVTFDDFMKLNGDPDGEVGPFPYLTLDINPSGVERRAEFVALFGTDFYFVYVVKPGEFSADLNYANKSSLKLNGAKIQDQWDMVWNYFLQGLPEPTDPSSLAGMSDVRIETMGISGLNSVDQGNSVNLVIDRGGAGTSQLTVNMIYPPQITGPSPVYIPAGSDSVSVTVQGVMGTVGPVEIRARPLGYPANGDGDIIHNISVVGLPPFLTFEDGLTQLSEGTSGGSYPNATSWTVKRWGGSNQQPLVVDLSMTNLLDPQVLNAVSIPATVTIPANQDTVSFTVVGKDGAYIIEITGTATDYASATRQVQVENINPVIGSASVTPLTVTVGNNVSAIFNATDVAADLAGLRGRWVWDITTQESTTNALNNVAVQHSYSEPGVYTVQLYVTDKDGGMTKYSPDWTVTVEPLPYIELTGGETTIAEAAGGTYANTTTWTITRWGAGANGPPQVVNLSIAPGGVAKVPNSVTIASGASSANFVVEGINGSATATVTATAAGYTAVTRDIDVRNVPPWNIGATVGPLNPIEGEVITAQFSADDVTADIPNIRGTWIWGDGTQDANTMPGAAISHTYAGPGSYIVTLVVTDGESQVQYTTQFNVEVSAGITLNVNIPANGAEGLENIGTGSITFDPAPSRFAVNTATFISAQFRDSVRTVNVTATPHQPDANGFNNYHFQFVSDGISEANGQPLAFGNDVASATVPVSLRSDNNAAEPQDRNLTVWFSREWMQGDNRGDIDGDGLTDEWEIKYGLNPRSVIGRNGGGGCPTGDRLPNAPYVILNPSILDPDGEPAGGPFGYPIPVTETWTGYAPVGPYFNNRLQFRGQTLDIWDDDFPGLDPTMTDSNGDGINDGWTYYFWANAINDTNFVGRAYDPETITGSLVIPNATIRSLFNPRANNLLPAS